MTKIRCPACKASGAMCSTCDGKRFVASDAEYDWRDFTETEEDFGRVDRDMRRAKTLKRAVCRYMTQPALWLPRFISKLSKCAKMALPY